MATEMITLKLEHQFLEDIDALVENEGYQSRTEFIRTAVREKVDKVKLKEAISELAHLKGKSRKKITPAEYERVRRQAFEALEKVD